MKKALNILIVSIAINIAFIIGKRIYYYHPAPGKPHIIIYGDSRVAMGDWMQGLGRNDVMNAGIGGATTGKLLDSLTEKVINFHPGLCILEAGINDIRSQVKFETTLINFSRIIDSLKRNNITVVVCSVIPISKDPFQYVVPDDYINLQVEKMNIQLAQLASDKGIEYLDINRLLAENKRVKLHYTLDGVHLNPAGFSVWYKEIKSTLNKFHY